MCRLLGVVSRRPAAIDDLLPGELPPFAALSPSTRHGWGIGWVGSTVMRREPARSPSGPRSAQAFAATPRRDRRPTPRCCIIRQASPGMPHVDGQHPPFLADGWCFAHNGYAWPTEVLDDLVGDGGGTRAAGRHRQRALLLAGARRPAGPRRTGRPARRRADASPQSTSITSLNCPAADPADALVRRSRGGTGRASGPSPTARPSATTGCGTASSPTGSWWPRRASPGPSPAGRSCPTDACWRRIEARSSLRVADRTDRRRLTPTPEWRRSIHSRSRHARIRLSPGPLLVPNRNRQLDRLHDWRDRALPDPAPRRTCGNRRGRAVRLPRAFGPDTDHRQERRRTAGVT